MLNSGNIQSNVGDLLNNIIRKFIKLMSSLGPAFQPAGTKSLPSLPNLEAHEDLVLPQKRHLDPTDSPDEDSGSLSESLAFQAAAPGQPNLLPPRAVPTVKHYWTKEEVNTELVD